jgi:hypothetical protein
MIILHSSGCVLFKFGSWRHWRDYVKDELIHNVSPITLHCAEKCNSVYKWVFTFSYSDWHMYSVYPITLAPHYEAAINISHHPRHAKCSLEPETWWCHIYIWGGENATTKINSAYLQEYFLNCAIGFTWCLVKVLAYSNTRRTPLKHTLLFQKP